MVILSLLTVVVVAIGIGAVVMGQGALKEGKQSAAPRTTGTTSALPTVPESALTTLRDDEARFTVKYPASWTRLQAPLSEFRLVATPNAQDYVSIRLQATDQPTTPQNLANIKAITDGAIGQGPVKQMLQQRSVTVNGHIGYYYLYTFNDETSGLEGAKHHYFLFEGQRMYMIVFQALPTDHFKELEPTFNTILQSFRADPEPAPTTTAPAPETTTTVP